VNLQPFNLYHVYKLVNFMQYYQEFKEAESLLYPNSKHINCHENCYMLY